MQLGLKLNWQKTKSQAVSSINNHSSRSGGCSGWRLLLLSLVNSTTQSSHDTSRCNAITHAAMQNLDYQILKSRISISTKMKLYNTCILPIFLYGSECCAVTKRDVHKIDALDQWCLRKLLRTKWYHHVRNDEVRRTTKQPLFGCCPNTTFLHVRPQCSNARQNRCQEDLNNSPHWRTGWDTKTPPYYVDEDYPLRPEIQ